ncbi:MAG: outer membrane beta-barrel protein [Acidobacteriota bacterium]
MKKTISFLLMAGCLCLFTGDVLAQSGFFLGLQGGVSSQKPGFKNIEFNRDTSFLYGARVGLKLMMISLELNYFQASHNIQINNGLPDWSGRQVDTNHLGLNFKYFLPLLFIHPYLSAGYGYYGADIQGVDEDRKRRFNLGAGIELHIGKKLSLLAEGRYHLNRLEIEGEEMKFGHFTLSGGFNFYF